MKVHGGFRDVNLWIASLFTRYWRVLLVLRFVVFTLCGLACCVSPVAGSEFRDLVTRVPGGANIVMAIDVQKTLSSPLGVQKGWGKRLTEGAEDRPTYLPPEADKAIVAVQADLIRGLDRSWEVAIMGMTEMIPMRLIARSEGGYVDTINGVEAAWVPSDAYFVQLDKNVLGVMAPADRQALSRWAEHKDEGPKMEISEYLSVAVAGMSRGHQIMLAVDAGSAVQIHRVKERLEQSGFAKEHSIDVEATAAMIAGLRSAVLEISFTDKATAVARIDFSQPVGLNKAVARAMVLAALDRMQMGLPDVDSWKCSVEDNSIVLAGDLSGDSLRRILSSAEPPSTKFSSLKDQNVEEASGDDMAKNSLTYFKTIDSMVRDLKVKARSSSSDGYWIDRYASKIDRLPILHVDDDLLQYGEKLTESLRVMSGSRKMATLQGAAASRSDMASGGFGVYNTGYGYGAYSYSTPAARERNAGMARTNAAAAGTAVKVEGWNLIDNATGEIRREMTKRYNIEF